MTVSHFSAAPAELAHHLPPQRTPGRTHCLAPGETPRDLGGIAEEDAERLRAAAAGSDTGAAVFVRAGAVTLVVPPFPIDGAAPVECIDPAPLLASIERPRTYAVFLLRLGGFAVGFFRGEQLIDSKVGQRFVKGRHRKGGQSSMRFARHREKQADELFDMACEAAARKLTPYASEIEHVFLGGDRRTLQAFRKVCPYFDGFGGRLRARLLAAHGDPRLRMLEAAPHQVTMCDVYEAPALDG